MSDRSEALAARFEAANDALVAVAEGCSDAEWRAMCADEERAVGVVVRHVAGGYRAQQLLIRAVAMGEPIPPFFLRWDAIHEANARHARNNADCDQGETVAQLRRYGADAAALVRQLTDTELDRTATVPVFSDAPLSTEQIITQVLIGHPRGHLAGIEATIGK